MADVQRAKQLRIRTIQGHSAKGLTEANQISEIHVNRIPITAHECRLLFHGTCSKAAQAICHSGMLAGGPERKKKEVHLSAVDPRHPQYQQMLDQISTSQGQEEVARKVLLGEFQPVPYPYGTQYIVAVGVLAAK